MSEPERHRLRDRHDFHWRHRGALLPLAIIAACFALGIILAVTPPASWMRDAVLGIVALAYFSIVHSARRPLLLRWPRSFPGKELLVGVLFTAGCAVAAWDGTSRLAACPLWTPVVGFAGLVWLNCTAIARWESSDESTFVRRFALALAAFEIVLSMFTAISTPRSGAVLVAGAMSALLLALLDCARTRMTPVAVRSAADLALLTPVPLLILAWALR